MGGLGAYEGGEASAVTRGCGTVVPLISSCDHSKLAQRRFGGGTPADFTMFHPVSTTSCKSSTHSLRDCLKHFETELICG